MKLALAALALGGCALYVTPEPDAGSDTEYDPPPLFYVDGVLTLHSTATSELCPAPTPRDPLVLDVAGYTITPVSPVVIGGSDIYQDYDYEVVSVEILDTWGDQPIDLGYTLTVTPDGRVSDIATGNFAGGDCDLTVTIDGTYTAR